MSEALAVIGYAAVGGIALALVLGLPIVLIILLIRLMDRYLD